MSIVNGDTSDDCITECETCGREFTGTGTWDVERHEGHGTRHELFPDEDTCPACKGEGRCEGTFTYEDGKYVAVECDSRAGRTRTCTEDNGSESHLGVYCDECNKFYEEEDE